MQGAVNRLWGYGWRRSRGLFHNLCHVHFGDFAVGIDARLHLEPVAGRGSVGLLHLLDDREVDGVFVFLVAHFLLFYLVVVVQTPVHALDVVLVDLVHEGDDVAFGGVGLAEERREQAADRRAESFFVAGVDALEEASEGGSDHLAFLRLDGLGADLLQCVVGFVHMLAVGMVFQIALVGFFRVGR